jgi:hypothetical protein
MMIDLSAPLQVILCPSLALLQVSWELWTTTNDECGTLCDQQVCLLPNKHPLAQDCHGCTQDDI